MSPRHHPPDELILDYAAGGAPEEGGLDAPDGASGGSFGLPPLPGPLKSRPVGRSGAGRGHFLPGGAPPPFGGCGAGFCGAGLGGGEVGLPAFGSLAPAILASASAWVPAREAVTSWPRETFP